MFYYRDETGLHVGTPEMFHEMTGAIWVEEMRINDSAAMQEIKPPHKSDAEWMQLIKPLYHAFRKRPPKLYLQKGTGPGRHSVHALEPIRKGTIVAEYLGEWSEESKSHSSYRWGPVDGHLYRNYGGMIEDGFPNLAPFHLYNVAGVPLRIVFLALDDVLQGEMLTVHYGMNHSVKLYYHDEYRLDKMCAFLSQNPLEQVAKKIKELRRENPLQLGWKKSLELENLTAKIRYLFQTPSALMLALLKHAIQPKETFKLLQDAEFRFFFLNFPFQPNPRQKEIIHYLEKIHCYFEKGEVDTEEALELLGCVRQRIFHCLFLSGRGKKEQTLLWNKVFDAVQGVDRASIEFLSNQAVEKVRLIQECLYFAKEIRSPLVPWLQFLANPPLPLSPTG